MVDRTKLIERRERLARRLAAIDARQHPGDELGAHWHLGTVGAAGRQSARLNARRVAALDRVIDEALERPGIVAELARIDARLSAPPAAPRATRAPRPERQPRERTPREAEVLRWYLYGDADEPPPEGLTEDELMRTRERFL